MSSKEELGRTVAYVDVPKKEPKVIVVGAHGVGKTALSDAIQAVLEKDDVLLSLSDKQTLQQHLDEQRSFKITPAPIVEPIHYYDSSPSRDEKHHNGRYKKVNRKKDKASRKARKQTRRNR